MSPLRFTLVADGPTDAVLLHPLRWLLIDTGVKRPIEPFWADLRRMPNPPTRLQDRIAAAFELYPCDLIFVHRDAEKSPPSSRIDEIKRAMRSALADVPPYVCVVPVRMTEAWLLFDEAKIRTAAGNPAGTVKLALPPAQRIEGLSDPKQALHKLLQDATELPARRLQKFSPVQAFYRLAALIDDFGPLRQLPAFVALEIELQQVVRNAGWSEPS